jgi:hypothetical protein
MKHLFSWRSILVVATAFALAACSSGSNNSSGSTSIDPGTPSTPSTPGAPSTPGTSNSPPTITGTPLTSASVGVVYRFQPSASDADGNALTFSVANPPSWASFDASTGRLSGTPTSSMAGLSFGGIVISVSDGTASTSLPAFAINVAAPNGAPVISGSPAASVIAGQAYSFQPTASDPENQTLTFSIASSPSWATFNSTTGRLSGTPTSANVGSYTGIVISVSDGTNTVPLPAFSITVTAAGTTTGSATLRWTPPTLNEDGTPIENLAGYRVYYGTSTGNLNQVLNIAGAGVTSAVIQNLTPATWYFALKAYNAANVESSFSNIASKTIY